MGRAAAELSLPIRTFAAGAAFHRLAAFAPGRPRTPTLLRSAGEPPPSGSTCQRRASRRRVSFGWSAVGPFPVAHAVVQSRGLLGGTRPLDLLTRRPASPRTHERRALATVTSVRSMSNASICTGGPRPSSAFPTSYRIRNVPAGTCAVGPGVPGEAGASRWSMGSTPPARPGRWGAGEGSTTRFDRASWASASHHATDRHQRGRSPLAIPASKGVPRLVRFPVSPRRTHDPGSSRPEFP